MKKSFGITLLAMLIGLAACQPYEDGPKISFKSKKERVVNHWAPEFVFNLDTNQDITEDYDNVNASFIFYASGAFEGLTTDSNDSLHIQNGLWDLVEKGEQIRILFTDPVVDPDRDYWTILRLKDDELWVTKNQGDTLNLEFRMVPADSSN